MKKEDIHPFDLARIIFGEAPPLFLVEVFVRTLIMYIALLLFLKWLGKRMNSEISVMEMTIMIMVGAIISVPMQFPESGLLQGMLILLCTLGIYNGLNWLSVKKQSVEKLVQGEPVLLLKDGVLQLGVMEKSRVSRQQLFSILRNHRIFNLGQVRRVYLEACGLFSVFEQKEPRPGLPIFPPRDSALLDTQQEVVEPVCTNCGFVQRSAVSEEMCFKCGKISWIRARIFQQ
jgi:uncharacterized membrane protein YcaP (DUF421 family)